MLRFKVTSAVAACHSIRRAKVGYSRLDPRAYAAAAACIAAAVGATWLSPLNALAKEPPHGNALGAKNLNELEKAIDAIRQQAPIKPENTPLAPVQP